MAKYNGHRSWAAWNVALWIGNDYGLYQLALEMIRESPNKNVAARRLLDLLPAKTPDGARYTLTSVREAIREY